VAGSRATKNLAGFNARFRFIKQKHICAALKKEAPRRCNNIKIKKYKRKKYL